MQYAINSETGEKISVQEYLKNYSQRILGNNNYNAPELICIYCNNHHIKLNAISSIVKSPYFAHPKHAGFCPAKASLGMYQRKNNYSDENNARQLKQHFTENWKYYYKKIRTLVPLLTAKEFGELKNIADKQNIWGLAKLKNYHLPYVFVTLADFPRYKNTKNGMERSLHFRFWFISAHNYYEDLINIISELTVCRASYKLRGKEKVPHPEQLMKTTDFQIVDDLMSQNINDIPDWIKNYI